MSQQPATKTVTIRSVNYMVADTREREVTPFLDDAFQKYDYLVKQISYGDYNFLRKSSNRPEPRILAVVERKTYTDFASGFKDGRYENLSKLLALRAKTGCQIYFIIEGPAFPSPNRKFSRIPFSSIEAAITKSMVRHGVMVIHTENQQHTARRLADLMSALAEEEPYEYPHDAGADTEGGDAATTLAETENLLTVPEAMTARIEESDLEAAIKAWARLRGISVVLGRILIDHFSVADLVAGKVSRTVIDNLKTATGRSINKDARNNLLALANGDEEVAGKILSGIRGISPSMATLMIKAANGAKRLLSYSVATMGLINIPQKNRVAKLGDARAERVLKVMSYKRGAETAVNAKPARASLPVPRQESPTRGECAVDNADDTEPETAIAQPEYTIKDAEFDDLLSAYA